MTCIETESFSIVNQASSYEYGGTNYVGVYHVDRHGGETDDDEFFVCMSEITLDIKFNYDGRSSVVFSSALHED